MIHNLCNILHAKLVSMVKYEGHRQQKRSQVLVPTLINFGQQFSSALARWRHWPRVAGGRAID